MISKLDAIQFHGIKDLLEGKEQANLQELEFRIQKVIRSLQGGVRTDGGNKRNVLELSRAKDVIDELLAFHGLGSGAGEDLFDKIISDEKRQRLSEKARKSKNKRNKLKTAKSTHQKRHIKPSHKRKKKSKGNHKRKKK